MTRAELIERLRRQVYGGFPTNDATITDNLVNAWITDGTALAAKQNYKDNFSIEGIASVNNSFYTTFKGLVITEDESFLYKCTLPSLPLGIGNVDGISRAVFKNSNNAISFPAVILSENQVSIQRSMRPIPNKILAYPEGGNFFAITNILLNAYTCSITMISGGDATNLSSTLNIPNDYISTIVMYVRGQLVFERNMPVDSQNDGKDFVKTT